MASIGVRGVRCGRTTGDAVDHPKTAFVLGGGGLLGAHEVGMLRALSDAGIRPDLVVGTSIGAVNGAFVAADPEKAAERLGELWRSESLGVVFSETVWGRAVRLARSG